MITSDAAAKPASPRSALWNETIPSLEENKLVGAAARKQRHFLLEFADIEARLVPTIAANERNVIYNN